MQRRRTEFVEERRSKNRKVKKKEEIEDVKGKPRAGVHASGI